MAAVHQRWEVMPKRGAAGTALFVRPSSLRALSTAGSLLLRTGLGMPERWLDRLPFDSWTWPGVALLVTVALPQR